MHIAAYKICHMKIVLHNWGYGHLKKGDIVRICWKFLECIKDYRSLHSASCLHSVQSTIPEVTQQRSKRITVHWTSDVRHFFSQRVVNRWNCLPQHVIDSASINVFKDGLNKMRRDSMGFFMDWLVHLAVRPHMFWGSSEQVRLHLVSYLVSNWYLVRRYTAAEDLFIWKTPQPVLRHAVATCQILVNLSNGQLVTSWWRYHSEL